MPLLDSESLFLIYQCSFLQVNLLGVPIGFSVAMSCVLANRVVLNVREISRDINLSKQPIIISQKGEADYNIASYASIRHPGGLTQFEMEQLRSMRAKTYQNEVIELYSESELPFRVL